MSVRRREIRRLQMLLAVLSAGFVAVGAAACSSGSATSTADPASLSTPPSTTSSPTSNNITADGGSLPDRLPASIKAKGHLVVGTEVAYPPFESYPANSTTPEGFDIDLGNAIAQRLGVTASWTNASFSGILAGLNAGRYDIVMSGMSDTGDREKEADFVNYLAQQNAVLVRPGNPLNIHSVTDLCGRNIAAQAGSTQDKFFEPQSAKCVAEGKAPLTFTHYQSVSQVFLAISTGRAEIAVEPPIPAEAYAREHPGSFEIALTIPSGLLGIAVSKTNRQLTSALQVSLQSIIEDGTYAKLLGKWRLPTTVGIKSATINGGAEAN